MVRRQGKRKDRQGQEIGDEYVDSTV